MIEYGPGEARGHSPPPLRSTESLATRGASQQTEEFRSRRQTSDQIAARKLQLGSCGESARLFIGLMGCRLQYNSQYYLTEPPEWSAATNGLPIRGRADARKSSAYRDPQKGPRGLRLRETVQDRTESKTEGTSLSSLQAQIEPLKRRLWELFRMRIRRQTFPCKH